MRYKYLLVFGALATILGLLTWEKPAGDSVGLSGPDDHPEQAVYGPTEVQATEAIRGRRPLEATPIIVGRPATGTILSITDRHGMPAVGAQVVTSRAGPDAAKSSTEVGTNGLVDLAAELASGAVVVVHHEGHASSTLRLPDRPNPLYEVGLRGGFAISGRVEMTDFAPVPEMARVFVWEVGAEIASGPAAAVYGMCGGRYSVEIEEDGTFQAAGLREGGLYNITVFGDGVIALAQNEIRVIADASEEHVLVAHYLYGAKIIADPEHSQFASMTEALSLLSPSGVRATLDFPDMPHPKILRRYNWGIALAGLAPPGPPRTLLPRYIIAAFDSPEKARIPATFSLVHPCFGETRVQFHLEPPRADTGFVEVLIRPTNVLQDSGSLSFHIGYQGELFDLPAGRKIPVQVQLESVSSTGCVENGTHLTFNAEWLQDGGAYRATEVPPGDYLVRLAFVESAYFIPRRDEPRYRVRIESGADTEVPVGTLPLGTLRLEMVQGKDGQYLGAARVLVLKTWEGSSQEGGGGKYAVLNPEEHTFERPPYQMGPFPAGDYWVRCYTASGVGEPPGAQTQGLPFPITINRGVNHVELDLGEVRSR